MPHEDLPLGIGPDVHAQLAATGEWETRFDLLIDTLLALVARTEGGGPGSPELAEAWRILGRSTGQVRIADLASHVGWSRRRLLSRFRSEYGVGPKEAARLFRFDQARWLVQHGHPLAEVAATCGYANQPHLTREWGAMAGRSPVRVRATPYFHPEPPHCAAHSFKTITPASATVGS